MNQIVLHARTIYLSFISSLCLLLPHTIQSSAIGLLVGSITFPTLQQAPHLRILYEGQIVKTEIHDNCLNYRIPTSRNQAVYFLLFTEKTPEKVLKQARDDIPVQNTIEYFTVPENSTYRVFELHYNGKEWFIIERLLPLNRRIPDSTIIIEHPALHLDTISGGNKFQLPSIVMKENIISLEGSEKQFEQATVERLLASLDIDSLHVHMKEDIKLVGNSILIKPTV